MNLGLAVYGQKPLAQTLFEARRMAEAAETRGVVTQMGIQLSSSVYERLAVQLIQDGVIGKVTEVHIFSHKTWGMFIRRPTGPIRCRITSRGICGAGWVPQHPTLNNTALPANAFVRCTCRTDWGVGGL